MSSIMPGKVNPVIPEVVNQVAFRVIGNDLTVTIASEAGQLELNVMEPMHGPAACFESIEMLINAMNTLRETLSSPASRPTRRCAAGWSLTASGW